MLKQWLKADNAITLFRFIIVLVVVMTDIILVLQARDIDPLFRDITLIVIGFYFGGNIPKALNSIGQSGDKNHDRTQ